jgi:hypothetical protein
MDIGVKNDTFSTIEMKELNWCRIYLQAFFILDITEINGKYISPWARLEKRCMERNSVWYWPVQQIPMTWAAWKKLTVIISKDNIMFEPLGQWIATKGNHQQEWFLNGSGNTLFSRNGDEWKCYPEAQIGRLLFSRLGAACDEPTSYTNVVSTVTRNRYVERKEMLRCQHAVTIIKHALMPYHSCVGAAAGAPPLHVQHFIGDMRHFQLTTHLDFTMGVDIIIATDGSVLFGVGYHRWLIVTTDKEILMAGGGSYDGAYTQMASYRSELGWIAAGLGVLGALA